MGRSSVNPNDYDEDESGGLQPMRQGTENNQSANDRAKQASNDAGLTEGQRKLLHKAITGNDGLSYEQIYQEALTVKRDYPNK